MCTRPCRNAHSYRGEGLELPGRPRGRRSSARRSPLRSCCPRAGIACSPRRGTAPPQGGAQPARGPPPQPAAAAAAQSADRRALAPGTLLRRRRRPGTSEETVDHDLAAPAAQPVLPVRPRRLHGGVPHQRTVLAKCTSNATQCWLCSMVTLSLHEFPGQAWTAGHMRCGLCTPRA